MFGFNQYKKIGYRKFEVEDFKKKVGAPLTYSYNDLKKRVIVPAQTQLRENTNLAFKFEEIKTGRSVTSFRLSFDNSGLGIFRRQRSVDLVIHVGCVQR